MLILPWTRTGYLPHHRVQKAGKRGLDLLFHRLATYLPYISDDIWTVKGYWRRKAAPRLHRGDELTHEADAPFFQSWILSDWWASVSRWVKLARAIFVFGTPGNWFERTMLASNKVAPGISLLTICMVITGRGKLNRIVCAGVMNAV